MAKLTFNTLCKRLVKRSKDDWDSVICITGEEGVGKSTMHIQLIKGCAKLFKLKFDWDKNIIYSPTSKNVKETMEDPKINPVGLDEAIKVLYKMDFQTSYQKEIVKHFTLNRKENKVTILCIPKFPEITKFFREHRILYWIHVYKRGKAILYVKDKNPYIKDGWNINETEKMIKKYMYKKKMRNWTLLDDEAQLHTLRMSPNYVGEVEFEKLSDKEWAEYQKRNAKVRYKDIEVKMGMRSKEWYNAWGHLCEFLYKEQKLKQGKIAQLSGFPAESGRLRVIRAIKDVSDVPVEFTVTV